MTRSTRTRVSAALLGAALLGGMWGVGRLLLPPGPVPLVPERAAEVMAPESWDPASLVGKQTPTFTRELVVETATGGRDALLVEPQGGEFTPAVVLLSGAGADRATSMLPWAEALAARGVSSLTLAKPAEYGPASRDFEQLAAEAKAAVQMLMQVQGVDPDRVSLVGFSEGGWIAAEAAIGEPRVSGVGMLSGPTVRPGEQVLWMADAGLVEARQSAGARRAVLHALSMPLPTEGMAFTSYDSVGALAEVDRPVLAVYGTEDHTVPVLDAASLVLTATGSSAQVRLAEGLGHGLTTQGEPDSRVVSTVVAWAHDPVVRQGAVKGEPPTSHPAAVSLAPVPKWHLWLIGASGLAAVGGWLVARRSGLVDASTAAGSPGSVARTHLRLAQTSAVSVLVNHVGLAGLIGLALARAPAAVLVVPWVGLKVMAVALAWVAARAILAGRPRTLDAVAVWLAGLGGLTGAVLAGAAGTLW